MHNYRLLSVVIARQVLPLSLMRLAIRDCLSTPDAAKCPAIPRQRHRQLSRRVAKGTESSEQQTGLY
ncbi:uncharacterized protein MYCGRDRAFT_105449 [Zymoseptoria tritici IPO323]|uniref:Uncharacterized protein n=1 Tax=Zymoseptoria tritici (strain CBS 115943 / IPO323) TaxID=336722 RepID=F9XHM9_ZYMTI|nr:uncharacterized protein MYCGRDRAFT_105449 [Zymoseptoria tritici IPO323]EGP85366.1 hypothetical protein MYCGRDRAFT_105449 [Zymoseptoria tritici IPO323]